MPTDWDIYSAIVKEYIPRVEAIIENARTPRDAACTILMSQLIEDFVSRVKAERPEQATQDSPATHE